MIRCIIKILSYCYLYKCISFFSVKFSKYPDSIIIFNYAVLGLCIRILIVIEFLFRDIFHLNTAVEIFG